MEDIYEHVGQKIRELREHFLGKRLTQDELAQELHVTPNTVSRWESATYRPSIRDLQKIADFFNVSISVFFPGEQDPLVQTLMSATGDLKKEDIEELIEYARFRRARQKIKNAGRSKKA